MKDKEMEEIKESLKELKKMMADNFTVVNATLGEQTKSLNQLHNDVSGMLIFNANTRKRVEEVEKKTKRF